MVAEKDAPDFRQIVEGRSRKMANLQPKSDPVSAGSVSAQQNHTILRVPNAPTSSTNTAPSSSLTPQLPNNPVGATAHSSLASALPFSSGSGVLSAPPPSTLYQGTHGFGAAGLPHHGFLMNHQAAAAYGCRMLLSGALGQTPGTVVVDNTTGQPVGIVTPCPPVSSLSAALGAQGLSSPPHGGLFGHGAVPSLPNLLPRPATPQQIVAQAMQSQNVVGNPNSSNSPKTNFLHGISNAQLQKRYQPLLPATTTATVVYNNNNVSNEQQQQTPSASIPSGNFTVATSCSKSTVNGSASANSCAATAPSAAAASACHGISTVSSIAGGNNAFSHFAAASNNNSNTVSALAPSASLFPSINGVAGLTPFPGTAPLPCVLANGIPTVLMRTSTGAIVAVPLQSAYPGLNAAVAAAVPANAAGGTNYQPILPHPPPPQVSEANNGGSESNAPSLPLSETTPNEENKEDDIGGAPPVVQSLPASGKSSGSGSSKKASKKSLSKLSENSHQIPKMLISPITGATSDTSDMPKLIPGDLFAPTDTDIRSIFLQEVEKNAAYRPAILTHVIDGYVIQESTEPFEVETFPFENFIPPEAYEMSRDQHMEEEIKCPPMLKPEILEHDVQKPCLLCGNLCSSKFSDSMSSPFFEKDSRFCSKHCYKKHRKRAKKNRGESLTSLSGVEEEESAPMDVGEVFVAQNTNSETPSKKAKKTQRIDQIDNQRPSSSRDSGDRMDTTPILRSPPMGREGAGPSTPGGEEISPRLPSPDKHPRDWTVEEVYGWVLSLGPAVANSSEVFKREEIDGAALMLLEEDHLVKSLGIKLGPAVKIAAALKALKGFPRL